MPWWLAKLDQSVWDAGGGHVISGPRGIGLCVMQEVGVSSPAPEGKSESGSPRGLLIICLSHTAECSVARHRVPCCSPRQLCPWLGLRAESPLCPLSRPRRVITMLVAALSHPLTSLHLLSSTMWVPQSCPF